MSWPLRVRSFEIYGCYYPSDKVEYVGESPFHAGKGFSISCGMKGIVKHSRFDEKRGEWVGVAWCGTGYVFEVPTHLLLPL